MIFAVEDRKVCTYYEADSPTAAIGFHLELTPGAPLEWLTVRRLLGEEEPETRTPPPIHRPDLWQPMVPAQVETPSLCLGGEQWVQSPARCPECRRRFYGTGGYVPPHYNARDLVGLPYVIAKELVQRMGEDLL